MSENKYLVDGREKRAYEPGYSFDAQGAVNWNEATVEELGGAYGILGFLAFESFAQSKHLTQKALRAGHLADPATQLLIQSMEKRAQDLKQQLHSMRAFTLNKHAVDLGSIFAPPGPKQGEGGTP